MRHWAIEPKNPNGTIAQLGIRRELWLRVVTDYDTRPKMTAPKHLLPTRQTAERYGVSARTIERWRRDAALGFPKPMVINGRNYHNEAELDAFDKARTGRLRDNLS